MPTAVISLPLLPCSPEIPLNQGTPPSPSPSPPSERFKFDYLLDLSPNFSSVSSTSTETHISCKTFLNDTLSLYPVACDVRPLQLNSVPQVIVNDDMKNDLRRHDEYLREKYQNVYDDDYSHDENSHFSNKENSSVNSCKRMKIVHQDASCSSGLCEVVCSKEIDSNTALVGSKKSNGNDEHNLNRKIGNSCAVM